RSSTRRPTASRGLARTAASATRPLSTFVGAAATRGRRCSLGRVAAGQPLPQIIPSWWERLSSRDCRSHRSLPLGGSGCPAATAAPTDHFLLVGAAVQPRLRLRSAVRADRDREAVAVRAEAADLGVAVEAVLGERVAVRAVLVLRIR